MQSQDIVIVNVVGTNGSTRNQKTISEKFDGAGVHLDNDGKPSGKADTLRSLPNGTVAAPEFPMAAYTEAQKAGDLAKMKEIQLAAAKQLESWEKSQGGGSELLQIAKSVLGYTKEFHGFQDVDGNHFVLKLTDLDVNPTTLKDGRKLYTVTGTAVFGAEA